MKDLDGAAHILELVLAAIDEGVFDAKLDEIWDGTSDIMRLVIARSLFS